MQQNYQIITTTYYVLEPWTRRHYVAPDGVAESLTGSNTAAPLRIGEAHLADALRRRFVAATLVTVLPDKCKERFVLPLTKLFIIVIKQNSVNSVNVL